jgi:DNA-directed RNA polymerase specialized sigma24 family protein
MHPPPTPEERRLRFEKVYAANHDRIVGYVRRRTESPHDAADPCRGSPLLVRMKSRAASAGTTVSALAAKILARTAGVGRFRSAAAFASYCGVAPLEASLDTERCRYLYSPVTGRG